jgi:hypothetical protein
MSFGAQMERDKKKAEKGRKAVSERVIVTRAEDIDWDERRRRLREILDEVYGKKGRK